jgi:hypothetical protein
MQKGRGVRPKSAQGEIQVADASFATAINCMDGRTQMPVTHYMKERCGVDYVDTVTEPGPDGILGDGKDVTLIDSIRRRVQISVEKHGSGSVAIVAHHDCAGNPVDLAENLAQMERAVDLVRGWGYDCEIIPLWVDEEWKVHLIDEAFKAEVRG